MCWNPETASGNKIIKIEVKPDLLDKLGKQTRFWCFVSLLFPHFKKYKEFVEEYNKADTEKEKSGSKKTVEEAAEIAARTNFVRPEKLEAFNSEVVKILVDDNITQFAKVLKLAKLFKTNPEVLNQLTKINDLLEKLSLTKRCNINIVSILEKSNQNTLGIPEKGGKFISDSEKDNSITIG